MIHALPNSKPLTGRTFDLLSDDGWLNKHLVECPDIGTSDGLSTLIPEGYVPISLGWFDRHPFEALDALGIENVQMRDAGHYVCPVTRYDFFSAVPMYLLPKNREAALAYEAVRTHYAWEMLTDAEWMRQNMTGTPSSFQRVLLGSGHTQLFMPDDGSNSLRRALIHLDNGDMLMVAVWYWFNK